MHPPAPHHRGKPVANTGETKAQSGGTVGDPHEQRTAGPQRVRHLLQHALLRIRFEVMKDIEYEYHVGVGQNGIAQIAGLYGRVAGERDACPVGRAVLQLYAVQLRR